MVHNILYYIVKEILKRTLVRMLICCVIALLFCITGNAKVPYIPKIINYSVSDYKAGNQNWAVSQGPGGKMYIGNNRGLLVFDGIHWDLVKLPNNLGVRLCIYRRTDVFMLALSRSSGILRWMTRMI